MTRARRPSAQTTAVVLALADEPATWRYGYELCQHLGLKAGSVYPILMRLADRGLLETAWETDPPAGRPPRHLYRLTGPGRALAGRRGAGTARPGPPRRRAATATGGHMSAAGAPEAPAGTEVRR
jgi:PadR family transcriptional regulator, regulatory protein PadR